MADRKNIEYMSVSDVENPHVTKYNVSGATKPGLRIPKLLCFLLVMGAILLAALAALAVYFFVPHECSLGPPPAAFTKATIVPVGKSRAGALVPGQMMVENFGSNVDVALKRLPTDVRPTHYTLKLMPFLIEGNFTTQGNVSIDIDCVEATDKIFLHAVEIDIDRISIRIKYVSGDYFFRLTDLSYDDVTQMYTFHLDRPMKTGEKYFLHMSFVSKLNDLNQGFYRSSYSDKETNTLRWIASSQFSPIDARRAFPCFDEPAFKATFTISLARPNYMTTLANTPRINTEDSEEMPGYSWDNYQTTPNMSTYLIAFVVSDLQAYEFNTDGREFKIWSRKDLISQSIYASQVTAKILKYYERYFDIDYPLPKLDQVAVPDFGFSAMENWGLITYRESCLLVEEQDANLKTKSFVVATISHEMTHQWFGNLVTPKFWNDLFLKEGFANFFRFRGVNHVEPAWNYTDEFLTEDQLAAMQVDTYSFSRALSSPIKSDADIRQNFDDISYSKGSAFVYMLCHIYGEAHFRDAIRHYLNKHLYGNADFYDFVTAFNERNSRIPGLDNNDELLTILSTWVQQPGFPVINVVADYHNNTLTLTQKRFRYAPLYARPDATALWWIPVSYASRANPDFDDTRPKFWMKGEREITIELDVDDWYLLNLKQTGYYIVNYDERNWKQIARNFKSYPLTIRAQLLANAMDLARANLLDYSIAFRLLTTVGRWDNQFVVYRVAFEKLEYVYDMLLEAEAFSVFNTFLSVVFDQAFSNTLPEESPTDTYQMRRLRSLILTWACKNSESRCVAKARSIYRSYMLYKTPVQPNLQYTVYCTAIREGGEAEFNHAYHMYLNATIPSDKETLLRALGCSEQPWLLKRYLNMMLDGNSGVRKQDGRTVFRSVAENIRGHSLALLFIRENWEHLKNYYGVAFNQLGGMLTPLSKYMSTPYHLEQLVSFGNSVDLATAKNNFKRVYENVQLNVEWTRSCYNSVHHWLVTHRDHFGY